MQIGKPFYIFSLLALTLKPTALSDDQRRMLTLFQQWWVRGLAVATPIPLIWLLWEIYPRALVASDITPFAPWGRLGGLAVAAGSFAVANLFLQVPISVLAVMATSDKRFRRTSPYPLDQIQAKFTQFGIPLGRLLPEVLPPGEPLDADQAVIDQAPSQVQEPDRASANRVSIAPESIAPESSAVDGASSHSTEVPNHAAEGDPIGDRDLKGDGLNPIDAEIPDPTPDPSDPSAEQTDDLDPVEAEAVEAEVLVAEAETGAPWNPAETTWDQSTHDWDQESTWDSSGETHPERNLKVAVVRISDPT